MIRLLVTRAVQVAAATALVRRALGGRSAKAEEPAPSPTTGGAKGAAAKPERRRPAPHRSTSAGKDAS